MSLPLVCVIFLFLCLRPCLGQEVGNPTESADVLRGTVLNKLTHEPIGRALVYSPDNRFAALTDGEGHFAFKMPKQDSSGRGSSVRPVFPTLGAFRGSLYRLMARKPGFLGDPMSQYMPVSAEVESTIFLIPEAIIQGRILVSSTEPSRSLPLQLLKREMRDGRPHWVNRVTEHTNSNGEFRFAELEPGEYKVMSQEQMDNDPETVAPEGPVYGFPPACFPGVPDFQSGTTIHLSMGQTFDASMTLARQAYFPVRIPVARVDPQSGINVSVLAQGHPGPGYSLGYNPTEHRIEGLLPSGTYLIQANGFGPHMATGMTTISVAGRELDGPVLAMAPISPIPIRVKEEFTANPQTENTIQTESNIWTHGQRRFALRGPRAYLNIYLEPVEDFAAGGGGALSPPSSPDDQTLEISNALPGLYWLQVNSSRGYPASITAGNTDLRQEPLIVSPGGNAPIEVTMRDDGATLEGTVAVGNQAMDGAPKQAMQVAHGAWIYCLPLPGSAGQFQQIGLSPDGKFRATVMAPGAYRVLAFASPRLELAYRDSEAMRAYDTLGQVVNLVAGQTAHVELELISGEE